MASLRPSFGSVLRDRNQRHNDDVVFKKNLKAQVKTAPPAISDESSENRVDSLIGNKRKKNNKSRPGSPEKPRTRKGNNFSDNLGGASSLVQIWEARLNRSNGGNSAIHSQSIEISSEASVQEIHLLAPSIDGESESENESKSPDQTVEIESGTLNSVSDIIRRLSNEQKLTASNNGGAVDMPIVKTPTLEKSSFQVVTCSPRIRGRQAYSDLLVHLERERHRELESLLGRNAVSRFPQRGRLQSMLRLRSLKRGLAIQDRHRGTTKSDLNRFQPSSTILHLREKLREKAANAAAEAGLKKGQQSTVETESMQSKETSGILHSPSTERLSPQKRNIEEAILRKNETETKMSYLQLKKAIVAEVLERESDNTSPLTSVTPQEPRILRNEEAGKLESGTEGTQETPFLETQEMSFQSGWEEQEEYEDEQSYYGDMSYDWFTEISRPRTYWEDLRKSRYLEVMNTKSDKDDICRLLERRTVSGFLQSGLREKIDKLIMSRVQIHPAHRIEEATKEEEKYDIGEEKDEDRDDLSQSSSQIFAPSPAGSWSSLDTGVTSTPTHNLHSTEMEIISEMRSHILQLQLEMSELRDSVKTCLDVNASLQKSVHLENPFKRKCCVCMEMKDNNTPSQSIISSSTSTMQNLKEIAALIDTGSYTKEVRRIARAVRLTIGLRQKLTGSVLSSFLDFALVPGSEAHSRLSSFVPKGDEHDMEVDTASSATQAAPSKHLPAELEIYCYFIVLLFLIDQKKYNEAKACSSASIARLKNVNRRTIDVIASRLYFYYSLSYEQTGDLAEIRGTLLALHHSATLRHDELGQETLLNLLLRNYLHYNLYDQAEKLRSKAPRFEAHSNQQFCRYLFYLGKIRTIQLEYTDAKESLLQAARKAPIAALGFRIQCNKWAILVRLLLGEIPERSIFTQKGMEKALRPYFELTNAVRIGDLELFRTVQEKFLDTFAQDRTHNLIVRLRHNVIRTGLRNISISYSRISLPDVAKKLRLNSENPVADAESIVAKAIRDGAIDATIDHKNGCMVSKETGDIYSTNEPQTAFNSRIAFCLNMHNEAVRALRFPPNTHKEKESDEKRRERKQQEEELAKHMAEEDDDDF